MPAFVISDFQTPCHTVVTKLLWRLGWGGGEKSVGMGVAGQGDRGIGKGIQSDETRRMVKIL